jgi:hypothetical protein
VNNKESFLLADFLCVLAILITVAGTPVLLRLLERL